MALLEYARPDPSASYGAAYARAPRHGHRRGRPGRTGHERRPAAARPGARAAGAPAGRRTLADRTLGVAALSVPELVTRTAGLRVLHEACASFPAAAREFAAANPEVGLAEEEPPVSAALPATVAEVESLDMRRENVAAIIWATGYRYDHGWLRVPVLDAQGRPLQQRGVTHVPGLYFLGLHWMHTFKSGLFSRVGSDAGYLADHMSLL